MATRMSEQLTSEEKRKLAHDLLPDILTELESALFAAQERQTSDKQETIRAAILETLLELVWEIEQHLPDPDEGLELRPEVVEQLRTALKEPRTSLEEVKRESRLDG